MKQKQKWLILLVTVMSLFSLIFLANEQSVASEVKELEKVVTGVTLLDQLDNTLEPDKDGVYQLRTNQGYRLRMTFDLSKYNGNLSNGDNFKINIPAPVSLYGNNDMELVDPTTNVTIADLKFNDNGDEQGGTITVTLKNLEEYLKAKGANVVKDVNGNFSLNFLYKKDLTNHKLILDSKSLVETFEQTHTTTTQQVRPTVGYENFAKNGGTAQKISWTSDKLKEIGSVSSGQFLSRWRVRVNTGGQDYGPNLVLNDDLPNDPSVAAIQYIPESLKVYSSPSLTDRTSATQTDSVLLTEGVEYTVNWNENYTNFSVTFKDGSQKYYVTYDTTTPNNGEKVKNVITLAKQDGTLLTQRSNVTRTAFEATATSLYSGTIVASTAYQIRIVKVDTFKLNPVAGAVYEITDPDGEKFEVTTNEKGLAYSNAFDAKYVGQTFTIKEKKAPAGYEIDDKTYTLVLGKDGVSLNLKDKPITTTTTTTTTIFYIFFSFFN